MKRTDNVAKRTLSLGHIIKTTAANSLLIAIALGLFLALGLREGSEASAVSAASTGLSEALRVNTAIYKGKKSEKAALLIAANWDASALESIVQTLDEAGCRATFALSRDLIGQRPALVKRLKASGHELAVAASQAGGERTVEKLVKELETALQLIEAEAGERPKLIYTGRDDELMNAARKLGLNAVKGSIDLICERGSAKELISRAKGNFSGGDIVVCAPTTAFSEALAEILEYFSSSGLTAATVSCTIYD